MSNYFSFLYLIVCVLFLSACGSYQKVPYFQDLNRSKIVNQEISNYSALTIQSADILKIGVSSLNPQAWPDSSQHELGYLVDQKGEVRIPLIGNMKVAGLSTSEASEQIQKKLLTYLKEPTVNVRLANFKIAVLGDVGKPDVYKVQSERITITEALSMAGDLNITAKRNNVLLVREIDGKREFITLNMNKAEIFTSPYYYLKNNDVVYIEPDKTKYAAVDRGYRTASLALSAASIIAIILTSIL